jgi:hypothetical protein
MCPKQNISNVVRRGVVIRREWLVSSCRMHSRRYRDIVRCRISFIALHDGARNAAATAVVGAEAAALAALRLDDGAGGRGDGAGG